MLVSLFMTVSLLSHAKHVRHHVKPLDRQTSGRLGGQTRALPQSLARSRPQSRPAPKPTVEAAVPKLFILILPPLPAPALVLPHPLMALAAPVKLTLQPTEKQEEEDLFAAINHERTQVGLGPLTLDPLLCSAAYAHSHEMCDLHYFNHQSPTEGQKTPMDRYLAARKEAGEGRPSRIAVGENIFYAGQTDSVYNADFAHQSLMASPAHRDNILAPIFTKVGVGLYRAPDGRFWVTEMFLQDD